MDATRESLRDQFDLYINNYHKFTLEVIPMLEDDTSHERLMQLYKTADQYCNAFQEFALQDMPYSPEFVEMSHKLKATLAKFLGINDKV